ncbi:MAG: methyl-accepting chemotaxis protein [Lachnospiraceae bacterium]|nr:methyl-accepting chemotaxis protein [Lachnospiraceae bacterium]
MSKENATATTEKKRKIGGVALRLIAITLLPVIVIQIIMAVISVRDTGSGMRMMVKDGMEGMLGGVKTIYDVMDSGDYELDEKTGDLMKGSADLTATSALMDKFMGKSTYNMLLTYGDEIKVTSITNGDQRDLIGEKITDEDLVREVLKNGKEFESNGTVIDGKEYYVHAEPLKNNDDSVVGMICVVNLTSDVDGFILDKVKTILIVALILILITTITTFISANSFADSIKRIEKALVNLSHGQMKANVDKKFLARKDEIGAIANAYNDLQNKLRSIIGDIKESSSVLLESGENLNQMAEQSNVAAEEISRAVEDVSKGAVSQAEDIEEASLHVNDMGEVVNRIVDDVETLDATSDEMKSAGDASENIIRELATSNDRTTEAIEHIGKQIKATNDSVQEIGEATRVITSIADQTSLLALNASIEAARAGEAGKGFAVVADEIGKLADQSSTSAVQIQEVINNLLQESERTVEVMQEVNTLVAEQQEKLNETEVQFQTMSSGITSAKKDMTAIKGQADTYFSARDRVADVIQNLSAISEENAASTQQTTASMEELNATINLLAEAAKSLTELSTKLNTEVSFFKMEE